MLVLALLCVWSWCSSSCRAEEAGCPCLAGDGGALDVYRVGGQLMYNSFVYPNDYGSAGCRAYDTDPTALQPYCGGSNGVAFTDAPAWCFDSFCYVDPNNCDTGSTLSGVFPASGLEYSYQTCGGESTFENWFGVNGTSSSQFDLEDLADVVEDYIASLRRDIEATYVEYDSLTTPCAQNNSGCPCTDCVLTSGWGTGISVDFGSTMFKPHATTSATARSTCISDAMNSFFLKVAGSEYYDKNKFANLYGGFQEDGSLSMYPEYSWCPTNYDPRFRPWYSTAATNPKVVIIVIDVSGSMGSLNRITLAQDAAIAVLDTLTWNDHVGIVLFNDQVRDTYPVTACTDDKRLLMKTWAKNNIYAGGGTDFLIPLQEAISLISSAAQSICTKIILFLTDGEAAFTDANFQSIQSSASSLDITVFSYALGSGAATDVVKRLACDNSGIFYKINDGNSFSEAMSSYYSYFAASINYTGSRWILYNDFATNTELLSACSPMYDTSPSSSSMAILIGVICMDMNMIVDVSRLRSHSQWTNLHNRILTTSQACSQPWGGLTEQEKEAVLEEIRILNNGNGAEECGTSGNSGDDSGGSSSVLVIAIVIPLTVLVVCGFSFYWYRKKNISKEKKSVKPGPGEEDVRTEDQNSPNNAEIQRPVGQNRSALNPPPQASQNAQPQSVQPVPRIVPAVRTVPVAVQSYQPAQQVVAAPYQPLQGFTPVNNNRVQQHPQHRIY